MVLQSVYDYFFATDALVFMVGEEKKQEVVIRVGDRVSVYSERFSCWFDDGIVVATFRASARVRYGFKKHFGVSLARGNEKTVAVNKIQEVIRPHKLHAITKTTGTLKKVCFAGQLHTS